MIASLTPQQKTQLNQMNRSFNYGSGMASGFSQLMADLLAVVASGNIGIQSNAYDVDSLCLNGGAFSQEADTTTGLTFGYYGGSVYNGSTNVVTAAGTIALTASATNYVEVDNAGVVHANTVSFTAGRLPLYTVVTSSGAITTVTNSKTLLMLLGAGSITGTLLSATGSTRPHTKDLGTLTATTTYLLQAPCTGILAAATLLCPTALAASNTNYWTALITNLGAAGAGTTAMLAATAANTTQSTGGFSLVANVPHALTLSGVGGATAVNDGDVLSITLIATGAPPALSGSILRAKFTFTG